MASELIERTMYNGLYQMVHNPNARGRAPRYKVTSTTGEIRPKGVTTILGQTLAKDFVSWAVGACVDYLRGKLPVITEADLLVASNESNRLRDSGASTGTEAHALVEQYLKGTSPNYGAASKEAQNAFNAFTAWFETSQADVINVEEVIYSHSLSYAGTYDCMLKIDGKVYLCDLKTTNPSRKAPNGVYAENFLQLGAYALAHEEQRKYEEANGGTKLVKIDGLMVISAKKNGKLDIVTNYELGIPLEECMARFESVFEIFNFMVTTTKSLGG